MSQLAKLAHAVVTDADLLLHITSFQYGIPTPLFEFLASHSSWYSPLQRLRWPDSRDLFGTIIRKGDDYIQRLAMKQQWTTQQLLNGYPDPISVAVECGRVDVLQWLLERGVPPPSYPSIWIVAFRQFTGDFTILNTLKTKFTDKFEELNNLPNRNAFVAVTTDMRLLKWIYDSWPSFSLASSALINAATSGNLEALRFILDHDIAAFDPVVYESAWKFSQIDVLMYLLGERREPWTPAFLEIVASAGSLELVKFIHKTRGLGELGASVMHQAAEHGHVDIVRFLHKHTNVECTTDAMDLAAANGHLEVVEFLHHHRSEGCTTRAMDEAAKQGYLNVVKFLHDHRSERCTTSAMDCTTSLEVVRFLHGHRREGCTSNAMDAAAASGNLEIVEFLHTNRMEGCTTNAMDQAAANGHLQVVRFLHRHRSEGCTTRAMGEAAANGHLEVVQFLQVNRSEGVERNHMKHLLLVGAFDVWLALREKFPYDNGVVCAMEVGGKRMQLSTVRFICEELGQYQLLPYLAHHITHEDVGWLYVLAPFIQLCGPKSGMARAIINEMCDGDYNFHLQYLLTLCGSETRALAVGYARQKDLDCIAADLEERIPDLDESLRFVPPVLQLPDVPDWVFPLAIYFFNTSEFDQELFKSIPQTCSTTDERTGKIVARWAVRSIFKGDLRFLKHLYTLSASGTIPDDPLLAFDGALVASIYMDRLDILRWLLQEAKLPVESGLLEDAILSQKLNIATWLLEHCPAACTSFDRSAQETSLYLDDQLTQATVDWLQNNPKARATVDIGAMACFAVMHGNIRWFEVFREMQCADVMARTDLLDKAAAYGHVPMLRHLLGIGYLHCSTCAMDDAITNGHLEVVRFLHDLGLVEWSATVLAEPEVPGRWLLQYPNRRLRNGISDPIFRFLLLHDYFDDFEEPIEWTRSRLLRSSRLLLRLYRLHPDLFSE
ncbi:hypothetical protein Poli38472_001449 [Pythium oligandrum]|uniref:Ankyrin repeat protein n=1 Tax=Pythium oligandrum TaxID=41045 RepID=A0A8K1CW19_PYTOL|nr:hypothetical protein Poli38472_001449 [Pythium oligandrum]|eukprot:TMW69293.1 hypothetical protein Poli38472_001449 [Pythium oligandrum]